MLKTSILVLCLLMTGCATGYKANSFMNDGGFEELELAPNYFRISFKGNEVTSNEKVEDFALLRATDLMLERGCMTFKIVKSSNDSRYSNLYLPQTQTTNANVTSYGNAIYGNSTTSTYGGGIAQMVRSKATLEVTCSSEENNYEKGILDTQFLNSSLKKKYQLEVR